ncbi:S1C family serine protease [Paenibacillus abyssi]|uniref:Peptidase S1 n=1 Tax=Paenibacillus abyssi TaxID=1340531 RepID=A0A917CU58_9BACL|nr:trypsin-like peptidase domain-containing protein [Paenibacillus abyssi]GGF97160.1 peptidase S1 [Paenibacillus abyssi]
MDDNKKNPYDDFFTNHNRPEDEKENNTTEPREKAAGGTESDKPSYYYSYGPFKPNAQNDYDREERASETHSQGSSTDNRSSVSSDVQITPPQPVRSFAPAVPSQSAKSGWQVREKKRTSFKAIFASFMAGVLVVGSLMAVADYQNWFTSSGVLAPQALEQSAGARNTSGPDTANPVSNVLDTARPNNIAQIFEQASPAVVKIETFVQPRANSGSNLDPFFRQFFGDDYTAPNSGGNSGELMPSGIGSGFFFDDTGYILTNQHVVGDAAKIEVTVQGYAKPFEAKLLGSSYEMDLAVLKVEGDEPFPTLALGSSENINIGDWVVAIGNPHGFDHTVTVGVLSSKERPISIPDEQGTRNYEHLLQTDASINPGNSGGPLLNTRGEVIGINTAVSSQAQGIGFAIPTSTITEVLDNLKENKSIPRPFIGAELTNLTDEYAQQLELSGQKGALVTNVYYNSPAYKGDLRQFDVITGMDGTKYETVEELIAAIQKKNVGDQITVNVIRNGNNMDLKVEIGDRNTFNVPQQ